MVSFNDLAAREPARDVVLPFEGLGDLWMKVDPNKFTIRFQTSINEAVKTNDIDRMSSEFFSLVLEWNLKGNDDGVMPRTRETIQEIPLLVFFEIVRAISEAMLPSQKSGTP